MSTGLIATISTSSSVSVNYAPSSNSHVKVTAYSGNNSTFSINGVQMSFGAGTQSFDFYYAAGTPLIFSFASSGGSCLISAIEEAS